VRNQLVEDFLERMDDDYFETFPPEEIAAHLRMSCSVDAEHRSRVHIEPQGKGEFKIVIVSYDYPSAFSILCGLLSSFGLDIRTGDIYSSAKRSATRSPGRLVDVFTVTLKPASPSMKRGSANLNMSSPLSRICCRQDR
jgi:UTP:GlnB (protein PII) uridylyltransferase